MHWKPAIQTFPELPRMSFLDKALAFIMLRLLTWLPWKDVSRAPFDTRSVNRFAWLPTIVMAEYPGGSHPLVVWLERYRARQRWVSLPQSIRLRVPCGWYNVGVIAGERTGAAFIRELAAIGREVEPRWRDFGAPPKERHGSYRQVTRFAWLPVQTMIAGGGLIGRRPGPRLWLRRYRLHQQFHQPDETERGRWVADFAEPLLADELRHTGAPLVVPHGTGDEADIDQVIRRATAVQRQK